MQRNFQRLPARSRCRRHGDRTSTAENSEMIANGSEGHFERIGLGRNRDNFLRRAVLADLAMSFKDFAHCPSPFLKVVITLAQRPS